MRLQNKVAIVTGAASGMGKAIAALYAKEGAKVVVADIHLEAAETVAGEIKSGGGEALAVKANVADESDIQNLIDTTVKTYGTVDILVNNAGIMDNFEPAGDIEDDSWNRIFAVNTTSVMRATRKVLPIFLAKQQGVIINVASAGGLLVPGQVQLTQPPSMRLSDSPRIPDSCMLLRASAAMRLLRAGWRPISDLP